MNQRTIRVPEVLKELHGERTRISTLIAVYLTGLVVAGGIVFQLLPAGFSAWKYVLVGILYLDISGGAVANLSTSTNQYYRGKTGLRIVFILLHILHPALFIVVLPEAWPY